MEQDLLRTLLLQASQQQSSQQKEEQQLLELQRQQQDLQELIRRSQQLQRQSNLSKHLTINRILAASQQDKPHHAHHTHPTATPPFNVPAPPAYPDHDALSLNRTPLSLSSLLAQAETRRHHDHMHVPAPPANITQHPRSVNGESLVGKAIVRGGGVNGGKGWKGGKGVETPAFSALKAPMEPNGVRYTSDQRVLLGGEWDFSYPLALVTHLKTAANITILCVRPQEDVACDSTVVQRVAMLEGLGATIHYNVDMADIGAVELPHLFDFVRWNNPPSRAFPRLWRADCAVKHFLQATAKLLKPGGATHIVSAIHFKEFNFPAVAEGTGMHLDTTEQLNNPFDAYDPRLQGNGVVTGQPYIYSFRIGGARTGLGGVGYQPYSQVARGRGAYAQ